VAYAAEVIEQTSDSPTAPVPPSAEAISAPEASNGFDTSTAERIEREFGEVEAALTRLDESRYGVCEITGEPISDDMLAADPVRRTSTADPVQPDPVV
jgi:RNA polymerase-binding transcription factor DksA